MSLFLCFFFQSQEKLSAGLLLTVSNVSGLMLSLKSLEIKEKEQSLPDCDSYLFCFLSRSMVKPNLTSVHIHLSIFIMIILSFNEILILNVRDNVITGSTFSWCVTSPPSGGIDK